MSNLTLITAEDSFTSREHPGETLQLADHCRFLKCKVGEWTNESFRIPAQVINQQWDVTGSGPVFVVRGFGPTPEDAWRMAGRK
jgi:hypothetical protein